MPLWTEDLLLPAAVCSESIEVGVTAVLGKAECSVREVGGHCSPVEGQVQCERWGHCSPGES